jgi:hypothetical protein
VTASECHTIYVPTPTPSYTSACSSVLSCAPQGSDTTQTAAPMVYAPFEQWGAPDDSEADDASVGSAMATLLTSLYGAFPPTATGGGGGGSTPTGSPSGSLGITLYWVNQLGGGKNSTDYVMQYKSNPCDGSQDTLFEKDDVSGSPQPGQVLVGSFGFKLPPGGFQCTYSNGDAAGPGQLVCVEGAGNIATYPCSRAPSTGSYQGTCGVTGVLATHYVAQVVC